jgi:hypothetical protein
MGQSGASIVVRGDVTCKIGDKRVGAQGAWLALHSDLDCLPRVYEHMSVGYTMETLIPLGKKERDAPKLVEELLVNLESLWSSSRAETGFSYLSHMDYIQPRCRMSTPFYRQVEPMARTIFSEIRQGDLTMCLTHGDPTFANLMRRDDGQMVIIDPLLPSMALPSIAALDLAKIMQSLLGFEAIRFGVEFDRCDEAIKMIRRTCDKPGWKIVKYLTAVHGARLLPYSPKKLRPQLKKAIITGALKLGG